MIMNLCLFKGQVVPDHLPEIDMEWQACTEGDCEPRRVLVVEPLSRYRVPVIASLMNMERWFVSTQHPLWLC